MEFKWGALLLAILLVPAAFAAPGGNNATQAQLLSAASTEAQCRVDFTVGYLNSIITAVPNSSSTLGADVSSLQSDLSTLQGYAASNDASGYRNYLSSTFQPAFASVRSDIEARPWKGSDNATLAGLKANYSQLLQNYQSCQLNALKSFAEAKIAVYSQALDMYANRTNSILNRNNTGMDTSALNQLQADAKSQILDPLQSAISGATNASQLRDAFNQYCLFDGCANGVNYHLAVKYGIARLNATLDAVQARVGANNSALFTKAQSDLANAESALASIGGARYTDGNSGGLRSSLESVNGDIQSAMAQARNMMGNRTGGFGNRTGIGNRTGAIGNRTGRGFGRFNRTANTTTGAN